MFFGPNPKTQLVWSDGSWKSDSVRSKPQSPRITGRAKVQLPSCCPIGIHEGTVGRSENFRVWGLEGGSRSDFFLQCTSPKISSNPKPYVWAQTPVSAQTPTPAQTANPSWNQIPNPSPNPKLTPAITPNPSSNPCPWWEFRALGLWSAFD